MLSLVDMTDLESAVLLSLYTDKRVGNQRGYWASEISNSEIGSELWTFERAENSESTKQQMIGQAYLALSWLAKFGHDCKITGKQNGTKIHLNIKIDGKNIE